MTHIFFMTYLEADSHIMKIFMVNEWTTCNTCMGGQDRSYLSLTFCNLLNLSEWAQEHLNDTEAFAWIFYIDWLHLLTKSSGLVFSNHDKGQGKKNLIYHTSSNCHICVWERKFLLWLLLYNSNRLVHSIPFLKVEGLILKWE